VQSARRTEARLASYNWVKRLEVREVLPLWAQWVGVAAALLAIVSVLGGLVFAWVRLAGRLERIDQRIQQLIAQANGHLALTGSLIGALNRRGI